MPRIGIRGSFGGLNIGDEAILTSMIASLRERDDSTEIVVFSRNRAHTAAEHEVDAVVDSSCDDRSRRERQLGRLDLLLLGGGGLLYDPEAGTYLREVREAQRLGVPTCAYALGAGPLLGAEDRATVRTILPGMDVVTVRDQESKRVLEDADVQVAMTVTADPAMLLEPVPFPEEALIREGVPVGGRLIGMSVREPGRAAPDLDECAYHQLLAAMADYMVYRYDATIVFVPMERQDVTHSHAVISKMVAPDRARVLHDCYRPRSVLGLMEHFDLVVGMRLHFLIFAALAGVPFLPLPYAGKVFDFAQLAGVPALPGMHGRFIGPLLATLDEVWDQRAERVAATTARIDAAKLRARTTVELAMDVLQGPGPEPAGAPPHPAPGGTADRDGATPASSGQSRGRAASRRTR